MNELTQILQSIQKGETSPAERLLPLIYTELRRLASQKMANEYHDHTLQPTALVHEAWLRLGGEAQPAWEDRTHFFRAAAEAMRRILIDRARSRAARRHGGGMIRVDMIEIEAPSPGEDILAIDEALARFAQEEPSKAELVKLRYFAGMTLAEAGRLLNISEPTAVRWWNYSKAWLFTAVKNLKT
jgi:RNA polymerase sigma factor (TIGR02999 family)